MKKVNNPNMTFSEKFLLVRFYFSLIFDCIFRDGMGAYKVYENNLRTELMNAISKATKPIDDAADRISERPSFVASPSTDDVIIKIVN